jgi:radical SAM-linked protein
MTPGEFRLRVCYGKTGRLRHLSHLEVVRSLERAVRRAGLPYAVTQGFSPHMKAAFGPALPVGTAGENEYLDVWLTRYTEAGEALGALSRVSPPDLSVHQARYVDGRTASLTIGSYVVECDAEEVGAKQVQAGLSRILGEGEFVVERKGKVKVFDLARSIPKDPRVSVGEGVVTIDLAVRMGQSGSLRPEALIRAAIAGLSPSVPKVRTTRLDTFVEGDDGVWSRPI